MAMVGEVRESRESRMRSRRLKKANTLIELEERKEKSWSYLKKKSKV